MKSTPLNKSYMVLAGIVVVMIALVVYMWIDAREIGQSLSQQPELPPKVGNPTSTQQGSLISANQVKREISSRPRLEPGEIVRGDKAAKSPMELQDRFKRDETVVKNRQPLRKERIPPTPGQEADWMFESGAMEKEEKVSEGETSVPE